MSTVLQDKGQLRGSLEHPRSIYHEKSDVFLVAFYKTIKMEKKSLHQSSKNFNPVRAICLTFVFFIMRSISWTITCIVLEHLYEFLNC